MLPGITGNNTAGKQSEFFCILLLKKLFPVLLRCCSEMLTELSR